VGAQTLTDVLPEPDREVSLVQGRIRYRETGTGPVLLFVHGLLVNGLLWRKVVPGLEASFRCVVPDWPLGSHTEAVDPEADLSPPGLAAIVAGFMDRLDLRDVVLVGNDTGGAICQLVATRHPGRLAAMVLTPCDAYETFPPGMFRYLQWASQVPGGLATLAQTMRFRALWRLPIAYGRLSKRPVEPRVVERWVTPGRESADVRRDVGKVLRGLSPHHTLEAARKLRGFELPVLVAWSSEDRVFSPDLGRRLASDIPRARLELIEDSWTYVPEDRPERLADLIRSFAA
jgi:pimeloyl-ACP methyl ester carboxylesterase